MFGSSSLRRKLLQSLLASALLCHFLFTSFNLPQIGNQFTRRVSICPTWESVGPKVFSLPHELQFIEIGNQFTRRVSICQTWESIYPTQESIYSTWESIYPTWDSFCLKGSNLSKLRINLLNLESVYPKGFNLPNLGISLPQGL